MKSSLSKIILLVSTSVVSHTLWANSQNYEYKCYVEYFGGGDGIQFVQLKVQQAELAKASLLNSNVLVIGSGESATVYKVPECVKENETFSLGRAQIKDAQTPR